MALHPKHYRYCFAISFSCCDPLLHFLPGLSLHNFSSVYHQCTISIFKIEILIPHFPSYYNALVFQLILIKKFIMFLPSSSFFWNSSIKMLPKSLISVCKSNFHSGSINVKRRVLEIASLIMLKASFSLSIHLIISRLNVIQQSCQRWCFCMKMWCKSTIPVQKPLSTVRFDVCHEISSFLFFSGCLTRVSAVKKWPKSHPQWHMLSPVRGHKQSSQWCWRQRSALVLWWVWQKW